MEYCYLCLFARAHTNTHTSHAYMCIHSSTCLIMKIQHTYTLLLSFYLILALSLSSCHGENDPGEAIAFVSDFQEEQTETRADAPLNDNFVVWGYKTVKSTVQNVFHGYNVTYNGSAGTSTDNTHGYSYVDPLNNQTIKYWDFGASEYVFWGYTGDKSHFNVDGTILTIPELNHGTVEDAEQDKKLFSQRFYRSPVSSDVVLLKFKRPYAKVRVMFCCGETLDAGDEINITNVQFGSETKKIVSKGSFTVTYSTSGVGTETYTTTSEGVGIDKLGFGPVTLDHTHGTASNNAVLAIPIGGTDCYYVVPYDYHTPFALSVEIDGDAKTAVLPAELMNWKPNSVYTYIFKITEAGKKIEFYDVKIDPWHYGGSQEDEWKNW